MITVSKPYPKYSFPYGKVVPSLNRKEYFVRYNEDCIGIIVRYDDCPRRYIIDQLTDGNGRCVEFTSLKKAVKYLEENRGNLVFCS